MTQSTHEVMIHPAFSRVPEIGWLLADSPLSNRLDRVSDRDPSSQGSMHVGLIVVHGEDLFEVARVWEDVEHPGEQIRVEDAPFGFAGVFGLYGAEHAELGMVAQVFLDAISRCFAEVQVPGPALAAERD